MITYKEVVLSVRQGKKALNEATTDVGYLRFLINKMTYQLSEVVLNDKLESL